MHEVSLDWSKRGKNCVSTNGRSDLSTGIAKTTSYMDADYAYDHRFLMQINPDSWTLLACSRLVAIWADVSHY